MTKISSADLRFVIITATTWIRYKKGFFKTATATGIRYKKGLKNRNNYRDSL
jgi:hypothetical protein